MDRGSREAEAALGSMLSSLHSLKVAVCTWNVAGSASAPAADLNAWLHIGERPDIIAVHIIEAMNINNPLSYSQQFNTVVANSFSDTPRADGLSEPLSHEAATWEAALTNRLQSTHRLVARKQQVGTCIFVFATEEQASACIARIAAIGTGPLGAGNKGAVAASLSLRGGSTLCLLCAHLAAGNKGPAPRNKEVAAILSKMTFPPIEVQVVAASSSAAASGAAVSSETIAPLPQPRTVEGHDFIVWGGDLNYRIALPDTEVHTLVEAQDFATLAAADELKLAQSSGEALADYAEGALGFAPTYKYDAGSTQYDTSSKRRAPAWTDRILWRRSDKVECVAYGRHELLDSDHRPVSGMLRLGVAATGKSPSAGARFLPPTPCAQLVKCFRGCFLDPAKSASVGDKELM